MICEFGYPAPARAAWDLSDRVQAAGGSLRGDESQGSFGVPSPGGQIRASWRVRGDRVVVLIEDPADLDVTEAAEFVARALGADQTWSGLACGDVAVSLPADRILSRARRTLQLGIGSGLVLAIGGLAVAAVQASKPRTIATRLSRGAASVVTWAGLSAAIGAGFAFVLISRVQKGAR